MKIEDIASTLNIIGISSTEIKGRVAWLLAKLEHGPGKVSDTFDTKERAVVQMLVTALEVMEQRELGRLDLDAKIAGAVRNGRN